MLQGMTERYLAASTSPIGRGGAVPVGAAADHEGAAARAV